MSSSPKSESPKKFLIERMLMCKRHKRLHDAVSKYQNRYADKCTFPTIVLGSMAGYFYIALAIEPISFVVVNITHSSR